MLDFQGLHRRLEEGNLDPKEVGLSRSSVSCSSCGRGCPSPWCEGTPLGRGAGPGASGP